MRNKIMKILGMYKNGNTDVTLFEDGTKIRYTKDDEFEVDFPESFDFKITDYCNLNCPMCHEKSTEQGKHGLMDFTGFLSTLSPYTEIACGGGNPLSHPQLLSFLDFCKSRNIYVNLTVNQIHLMENKQLVQTLIAEKFIRGLGISYVGKDDELIEFCKENPNCVVHLISGLFDENDHKWLKDKGLKILILGYKDFGRGADYKNKQVEDNISWLKNCIIDLYKDFVLISFDNLALEQLNIQDTVSPELWKDSYMGGDGSHTMYIDLVKQEFARTSTSVERHKVTEDIKEMFNVIKAGW